MAAAFRTSPRSSKRNSKATAHSSRSSSLRLSSRRVSSMFSRSNHLHRPPLRTAASRLLRRLLQSPSLSLLSAAPCRSAMPTFPTSATFSMRRAVCQATSRGRTQLRAVGTSQRSPLCCSPTGRPCISVSQKHIRVPLIIALRKPLHQFDSHS